MPNGGAWVTAVMYFVTAYSCRKTSTCCAATTEHYVWTLIAVALMTLGLVELINLPTIIADLVRSTAKEGGWYGHREFYQVRLIYLAGVALPVAVVALLFGARNTSIQCGIAVVLAGFIVGYIIVRAISLHSVDAIMGRTMFGIHFNRIPEIGAVGLILLLSAWRMIG
jgi:hypothetical protein